MFLYLFVCRTETCAFRFCTHQWTTHSLESCHARGGIPPKMSGQRPFLVVTTSSINCESSKRLNLWTRDKFIQYCRCKESWVLFTLLTRIILCITVLLSFWKRVLVYNIQSNLSNCNIKGMEFFFNGFEVRMFQNMEDQMNGIWNIEVFKQMPMCTANHRMSGSCVNDLQHSKNFEC